VSSHRFAAMTIAIEPISAETTRMITVDSVQLIGLPRHARDDGEIVVAEVAAQVPFPIKRVFTVTGSLDAVRGDHAHRGCTQFVICVHGAVEIICDDGQTAKTFRLDRNNLALNVPPTIWNKVIFKEQRSVVIVLCDLPFEEDDYMRDYAKFLAFRKANS
jgi:hypothetical protein